MEFSKTQLSNFAILAGLLVIILAKMGISIGTEELTFIIGACWSIGWSIYSYINRYYKGDITLSGIRK